MFVTFEFLSCFNNCISFLVICNPYLYKLHSTSVPQFRFTDRWLIFFLCGSFGQVSSELSTRTFVGCPFFLRDKQLISWCVLGRMMVFIVQCFVTLI